MMRKMVMYAVDCKKKVMWKKYEYKMTLKKKVDVFMMVSWMMSKTLVLMMKWKCEAMVKNNKRTETEIVDRSHARDLQHKHNIK